MHKTTVAHVTKQLWAESKLCKISQIKACKVRPKLLNNMGNNFF